MTDTELINALGSDEYGTGLIIRDTEGNEYTIKRIYSTMGGQVHQVIEIEKYDHEYNFFRDRHQCIDDAKLRIEDYKYAIEHCNFKTERLEKFKKQMEKQIIFQENLIKHYENESS